MNHGEPTALRRYHFHSQANISWDTTFGTTVLTNTQQPMSFYDRDHLNDINWVDPQVSPLISRFLCDPERLVLLRAFTKHADPDLWERGDLVDIKAFPHPGIRCGESQGSMAGSSKLMAPSWHRRWRLCHACVAATQDRVRRRARRFGWWPMEGTNNQNRNCRG